MSFIDHNENILYQKKKQQEYILISFVDPGFVDSVQFKNIGREN